MRRLFFLPGVGADPGFWKPLGDRLPAVWDKVYFGWPGLGAQPAHPDINGYDDLVAMVETQLGAIFHKDGPVDLLAQSMGGAIAMTLALRHPEKIRRLVLSVTAGGMDISPFGAEDWRPEYRRDHPHVAEWVADQRPDVSTHFGDITQPTLLLWGDDDPISPLAIGQHLKTHLPNASLHVVRGGQHDLVHTRANEVEPFIYKHLA